MVKWLPEHKLFSWFGRGFPPGLRKSYPVEAYISDNVIHYVSVDLSEYSEMGEEIEIIDIYDENGDEKVGSYNTVDNTFDFTADIETFPKYLYRVIPNGDNGYYILSKQRIN